MPLTLSTPTTGNSFPLGNAVEFSGTADPTVVRVELVADDRFPLPTVTLANGSWELFHRFNGMGRRKIVATAFDSTAKIVGTASVEVVIQDNRNFAELVKIPAGINKGLTAARHTTMIQVFGKPGSLTQDCSAVTNLKLKALLVTQDVGPFAVTGIRPAVDALDRIFDQVKAKEPSLFTQLGTAGMLCCRRIRRPPGKPPSKQFSNHSWGTAVDIKIKGALDPRGDGKTQLGLLVLAPFFQKERFFWGAGFKGAFEDAMHFEASDELVKDWSTKRLV